MAWNNDRLAPVETLLFRSNTVKVGCFRCAADHPSFAVTESLDNDVFVFLRKSVWIRRNDDEYRFIEPGGILMHRAGCALERRRTNAMGEHTFWFGVHPDLFVESLQRHSLSTLEMGGALVAAPQLRYRLALLLKKLEENCGDRLAVEEQVLTSFLEICRQRADQAQKNRKSRLHTAARRQKLVDTARAYLDEHLTEAIGLESVANAAGASMFHLCRVFREQIGLTMHEYRTRQRLGRVLDCLLDDDVDNLTDLALQQGFSSHSHLSRLFHQHMGVPPSTLRSP